MGYDFGVGSSLLPYSVVPLIELSLPAGLAHVDLGLDLGNERFFVALARDPCTDEAVDIVTVFGQSNQVVRGVTLIRSGFVERSLDVASFFFLRPSFLGGSVDRCRPGSCRGSCPRLLLGDLILRPSWMEGSGGSVGEAGSTVGKAAATQGGRPAQPNSAQPISPYLPGRTAVEDEETKADCCESSGAEAGATLPQWTPGGAEADLPVLAGCVPSLAPEAAAKPWECGRPLAVPLAISLAAAWILVGSVSLCCQSSKRLAEILRAAATMFSASSIVPAGLSKHSTKTRLGSAARLASTTSSSSFGLKRGCMAYCGPSSRQAKLFLTSVFVPTAIGLAMRVLCDFLELEELRLQSLQSIIGELAAVAKS